MANDVKSAVGDVKSAVGDTVTRRPGEKLSPLDHCSLGDTPIDRRKPLDEFRTCNGLT
jgi:hypothetical protein